MKPNSNQAGGTPGGIEIAVWGYPRGAAGAFPWPFPACELRITSPQRVESKVRTTRGIKMDATQGIVRFIEIH